MPAYWLDRTEFPPAARPAHLLDLLCLAKLPGTGYSAAHADPPLRSAPVPLRRDAVLRLVACEYPLSRFLFQCLPGAGGAWVTVTLVCLGLATALVPVAAQAAGSAKTHTVALGAAKRVPYIPPDATAAQQTEDATTLKVRPLLVDGRQKEWTLGEAHEVTDRSFTIRRALHLNDALPGESVAHWIWQPGPWLLVDRASGHIAALHLPEFDPLVSEVVWYRDYGAYCGIAATARGGVYAIVAQLGARRAVVQKQLAKWPLPGHLTPVCRRAEWQRQPTRVTLGLTSGDPIVFDVVGTAALVEEGDSDSAED